MMFECVLLYLIVGSSCDQPLTEEQIARSIVSSSNNDFSLKLYEKLSSKEGNLVISPLSAQTVLTMVWFGAGGTTATQLESALSLLPKNRNHTILGFKNMQEKLKSTRTVTLDVANKFYLQKGLRINNTYQRLLDEGFKSTIEEADFANQTEAVRVSINQWVEQKTHGKIKELITEGSLSSSALLVAVNALYFQGGWATPFDKQETTNKPFYLTDDKTVEVPTMHLHSYLPLKFHLEYAFQALKLRYRGPNDDRFGQDQTISMVILLPERSNGLSRVESFVASENFTDFVRNMGNQHVKVSLPRFKVENTINLKEALKELGVTELFQQGVDLSGISNDSIYVNEIIQKGIVEVTEKGTEAAAATFIQAVPTSLQSYTPEFQADHPFLFLIMDEETDIILFMGRVVDPR